MKKFEEEFDKKVGTFDVVGHHNGVCCLVEEVKALGKDWVSPEDHQAEIDKRKQQYKEHQEIYSKTAKKLNDAELELSKLKSQLEKQQPEIPEVPQFVADWYEENKGSLDYMIFETCRDLTDEPTDEFETWFGNDKNKSITTLVNMKNGYTVAKEKRFYLKNKLTGLYLYECKKGFFEQENLAFELTSRCDYTQQEIDSMAADSYEQIEVEE